MTVIDWNNYDDAIKFLKRMHIIVVWLSEFNRASFRGELRINPKSKSYKQIVEALKLYSKEDCERVRADIKKMHL